MVLEAKKEVTERYSITEIVTQTDTAVKDNLTGDVFTEKGLILELLNKIDRLEKAIAG